MIISNNSCGIFFYGKTGKYGFLSNLYYSKFKEGTIVFNCSQQYLAYYKLLMFDSKNNLKQHILNEQNPIKLKFYGRQVNNFDESKWNYYQYKIMKECLILKFQQNEILKTYLIDCDQQLYYASKDRNWGIGFVDSDNLKTLDKNLFGENKLGKCLMDVRKLFL